MSEKRIRKVKRKAGPPPKKYWFRYGRLGQEVVEKSEHIQRLLEPDWQLMDGHAPGGLPNLPDFKHLDIIYLRRGRRPH